MSKVSVNVSQLQPHPEILGAINIEAVGYLFTNDLSDDLMLDHIDLNAIPVIKKPGQRVKEMYFVIGSLSEFFWILDKFCSQPNQQIIVDIKESFNLKKSLNSISYQIWGRKNDPGTNSISAALFKEQEKFRRAQRFTSLTNGYLLEFGKGKTSRIKHFTGFDSRALVRSGELTNMPPPLQEYVVSELELKIDVGTNNLMGEEVVE